VAYIGYLLSGRLAQAASPPQAEQPALLQALAALADFLRLTCILLLAQLLL
jgi:hypothetical protein